MKDMLARYFSAQAAIAIAAVGLGLAALIVWASQVEVSTKASLLASNSATPTSKKNAPPTATFTGSPPAGGAAPLTPTQVALKTFLPSATVTPTRQIAVASPTLGMPIVSATPLSSPTASVNATATAAAKSTVTNTPTSTPVTGMISGTATSVPTATPSAGSITFTANSNESILVPGDRTNYTLVFTNTSSSTLTVILGLNDNQSTNFLSTLSQGTLIIPPRSSLTTTLVVSADAKASGEPIHETSVTATVNGIERGKLKFKTRLLHVSFGRTWNGLGVSERRIAPATGVNVQIAVSTQEGITSSIVTEYIPRAWTVSDSGGGTLSVVNADTQKIDWSAAALAARAVLTRTYSLVSPAPSTPAPQYQFKSALTLSDYTLPGSPWQVLLEHPLTVKHYRIGQNRPLDHMDYVAALDEPAIGISSSQTFRVRFSVTNNQSSSVKWQPRLEWSARPNQGFQVLPAGQRADGRPFYLRPLDGISNGQAIPVALFGLGQDPTSAQPGVLYTSENSGATLILNPGSTTEIEYSLRPTLDAAPSTVYYFQLSDNGRSMPGKIAQIQMGASAPLQLTQPQYAGVSPNPGAAGGNRAAPLASSAVSPHGAYSPLEDDCAACHRTHTSRNGNLVARAPAQSNLCFACHNGTGASTNIQAEFTDASVPANDATTSAFYAHPATAIDNHTNAATDEFKGVLNRHSECGDCHNPHSGDATLSASTASGFTVSGALKNIAGVDSTSKWKAASAYEYELCYKCHSSYTVLLSYTKQSYKMFDQIAEFNPANPSFHPIQAVGKNATAAMAASLAGTSPYKLWNFTVGSVIRCENCHGNYRLANPAAPPAANARNAPHTSKYMNILMNNYRDRVLKSANETYSAADSALCLQCHAEAPFAPGGGTSTATNFPFHSRHMTDIGGLSASTDIDTPGAGPGKAICAECHYRIHGQGANASGNPSGQRLVNFAPNVTASGGQLKWDPATRTCYLTCHGDNHNPEQY